MRILQSLSLLALTLLFLQAPPALAGIDNTVTVTGSSPGNSGDVTASATFSVTVQAAAPALGVTIVPDRERDVAAGETVRYRYLVENTGNVTLTGIRLEARHEGAGTQPVPALPDEPSGEERDAGEAGESVHARLSPGETVEFAGSYTVVQADLEENGGGDGALDSMASATATYAGRETAATASVSVDLEDIVATLAVTKTADRDADVRAGDMITYTYTVTNTGNVTIRSVSLSESHNGSGPTPAPGNERLLSGDGASSDGEIDSVWDVLAPGDTVEFTATYIVTQTDIDTLQ